MGVVTDGTGKYQACIDECSQCAQACVECMNLCLNEPDAAERKKCISKLHECACICKEAAFFMTMDSRHAADLCKLCALICEECGQECEMFQDDHCIKCAEVCDKCANDCQSVQFGGQVCLKQPEAYIPSAQYY